MILVLTNSEIPAPLALCSALRTFCYLGHLLAAQERQPRGCPQCNCACLGLFHMVSEHLSLGEKCWHPKRGHFLGAA